MFSLAIMYSALDVNFPDNFAGISTRMGVSGQLAYLQDLGWRNGQSAPEGGRPGFFQDI